MSSALMPTAATEAGSVTSHVTNRAVAVVRQVALDDVGDDDLVAVGHSFGARWRPTKPSPPKMTCLIGRARWSGWVSAAARAVFRVAAPALGDQHRADADEGDAGDAPGVEILAEDEIGEHRDRDIGEAEERIGEGQLDLGQHVEMRRHRDDEGAAGRGTPTG